MYNFTRDHSQKYRMNSETNHILPIKCYPSGQTDRRNREESREKNWTFFIVYAMTVISDPSLRAFSTVSKVYCEGREKGVSSRASFFWHNYELDPLSSLERDASRGIPSNPPLFEDAALYIARYTSLGISGEMEKRKPGKLKRQYTAAEPRQC